MMRAHGFILECGFHDQTQAVAQLRVLGRKQLFGKLSAPLAPAANLQ